jgi:hypothetical protein
MRTYLTSIIVVIMTAMSLCIGCTNPGEIFKEAQVPVFDMNSLY